MKGNILEGSKGERRKVGSRFGGVLSVGGL